MSGLVKNMNPNLNADLEYALKIAGYSTDEAGKDAYRNNLIGRMNTRSANENKILGVDDINRELNRLGLAPMGNAAETIDAGKATGAGSIGNAVDLNKQIGNNLVVPGESIAKSNQYSGTAAPKNGAANLGSGMQNELNQSNRAMANGASNTKEHFAYALTNAGYGTSNRDMVKFVENMLGRIGTVGANGEILTEADVYRELNRLGLTTKNV